MDKLVYTNMDAPLLCPNVYINSTTAENKAATFILNAPSAISIIPAAIQLCVPIHQHKNQTLQYEVRHHRRSR